MPKAPAEPTNIVLERLRLTRAETTAALAAMNGRFDKLEAEISEIKKDLRGFKLNTIAEVY